MMLLLIVLHLQVGDISYYDVISNEGHLFMPLGWIKPDTKPRYELIGTIMGEDFARAYVRNIRRNRLLVVSVGDSVGSDVVDSISTNKVKMKSGKSYVGDGLSFLSTRSDKRKRASTGTKQTTNGSIGTSSPSKQDTARRTQRMSRGQGRAQWQEQIEKFQKSSPEEQSRMIEQFRNRRGRRTGDIQGN